MTFVGGLAILLTCAAITLAWQTFTIGRLKVAVTLLIIHLIAALYYLSYSENAVADASGYYFDVYNLASKPFGLGTVLVVKICYFLKRDLGASYLDAFLLFQAVGFAGMMIMLRVFAEIETKIGVLEQRGYNGLLFLPSVNFWTSAIGKDAPLFFAVALCTWAMLQLRARFFYFALSLVIMVMFRAHIALMAATALAAAALFEGSSTIGRRIGLLTVAIAGIFVVLGPVQSTLNVDVTSASAVSNFLDKNNQVYATVAGTTSVGHASFLVRFISLLFRPFFFDAHGFMGIVASLENVGVVLAVLYTLFHVRDLIFLARRVLFVRFALLFGLILVLSLVLVYYNVGLGLRQRVMAYPMFFSVLVALWSMRRRQALPPAQQVGPNLMTIGGTNRAVAEI